MTKLARFKLAGVACAFSLASTMATATTLKKVDFEEAVELASIGVIAEAGQSTTMRLDGGIVTDTTFTVSDAAFGEAGATITVRTQGGALPGAKYPVAEVNAGAPRFFSGASNFLLLSDEQNGVYSIVGYSQGVFDVIDTPEGRAVRLPDSVGGVQPAANAIDVVRKLRNGKAKKLAD